MKASVYLWSAVVCIAARGQSVAPPQFEVASVKPSVPFTGKAWIEGGPGTPDPSQITYHDRSLTQLIYLAYNFKSRQASLPSWIEGEHFDIVAKVPVGATKADLKVMLRGLLEDRFHLQVGYESRKTSAYSLTIGKDGSKMKEYPMALPEGVTESAPRSRSGLDKDGFLIIPPEYATGVISTTDGVTRFSFARMPLALLCSALANIVDAPVIDETGLVGRYDIRLAFAQEMPSPLGNNAAPPPDPAPSLFGAIEKKLGLRLERKTMPVEFFVVKHADKMPTEN